MSLNPAEAVSTIKSSILDKVIFLSDNLFMNDLIEKVEHLLSGETDYIANAANVAALLYQTLPEVNWVGFYFMRGQELVLGPFQGKPACVRIPQGKGVCGSAAIQKKTLVVADVHQFPGHIACDTASNSEIVIPIIKNEQVLGVLDIDSPKFNRFNDQDRIPLEAVVSCYLRTSKF